MNYTVKRYFFEQSAVREFYSGAYYDLFLVMRGSGVFRCSERKSLPKQRKTGEKGREPQSHFSEISTQTAESDRKR